MKKLLTFLTLLTLSIGISWAADVTVTTSISDYAADNNWSNDTRYSSVTMDDNITATASSGTNTGKYYSSDNTWRFYANENAKLTINAASGCSLKSVTLNFTVKDNGTISYSGSRLTSGTAVSVSGTAAEFTISQSSGSKGKVFITSISVTYSDGGSNPPTPTTYSITGTGTQTGGSVTASATSNITEGTSITITATPNTGYELSNLTVDGNDVTSSVNSSYEYTFNMPAHDVAVSATFTEQSTPQPSGSNTFQRITKTSDLEAGKRYLIVYQGTPAVLGAISNTSTKYGLSVTGTENFTLNNGVITLTDNTSAEILTLDGEPTMWTFQYSDNKYLFWSSGNSLNAAASLTTASQGQWVIQFQNDGSAKISNVYSIQNQSTSGGVRYLKYNTDNPRFACYTTNPEDIYIYKEVESTPQSNNVFIVGQINGHDSDPWNTSEGFQLTYNSDNDNYAANIYCTGMKNGNDDGYSYFIFVKSLPFDWNTASNFYGSGADGSYWGIGGQGESAFGEAVPLYDGSKNVYRLPAGLYTVSVALSGATGLNSTDKSVTVTKRDVTFSVTSSASFDESKNVTMSSNLTELGGKIWYTTDGSDPRTQSNSNRHEYTSTLTFTETTNLKAVAVLGCIYSDVVERTYTKKPAAPEISPASCTFNEPLTVTITAESGATIYYTTDGSAPTNESTQYNGPFTVSTTTTVKAIAYVGEAYSSVAEATYTYSNVQPSTGDFVLVTSADQLVAGNEYIIMTTDRDGYKLAMGDLVSKKGTWTQEFDINGNVGAEGSTVSVYSESSTTNSLVNILVLEDNNGSWSLKQKNAGTYLDLSSDKTDINTSSSKQNVTIEINGTYHSAKIQGITKRQILYSDGSEVFANYATSNAGGSGYEYIYLYTRETNSVQPPVFSPIAGLYDVDVDVTISCATDGATIYYTDDNSDPKTSTTRKKYTGEIVVSASTTFKAVAVKGENSSNVVTAEYIIQKETDIETVTLTYSEPFTSGIGKFRVDNVSGFSPVWSLDGNYGIKGTSFVPATKINHAAVSRLVSPIIDMTGAVQPELTFSYQINSFFTNPANQCQLFIRETTDGTDGTWVQLPMSFVIPAQNQWSNDFVDMPLLDYAGKKVQISFLYTNPTEGTGAGTWEIQNFVVADNSEYHMVNNIAEFLALDNGTKAKFKNPVTVLYDYAQSSDGSLQEYIWVKDESGFMQFYMHPTLNTTNTQQAFYENGDIIPAGFVVVKNYFEYGSYIQAYSDDALNAGFLPATQKGLADPDYYDFDFLNTLSPTDVATVAEHCNRYITLENIRIASKSGNSFTFSNANGTVVNACVGFNKFSNNGSLKKDGTSAVVTVPNAGITTYNVKAILQLWKGNNNDIKWEILPIEITEWKEEEVTLRKLCAEGSKNNSYKISNNLLGVYSYYDEDLDADVLWVKDDNGQSINMVTPKAPYTDNFAIEFEDIKDGNGNVIIPANPRLDQTQYDQSNWCQLILTSKNGSDFVGKIINGGSIHGKYIDDLNPTIEGVELTENDIYSVGNYVPNYYIPASFVGSQSCATDMYGNEGHGDFFFMTPKPQEYAMVVWAVWDGQKMNMPTKQQGNSHELFGGFSIDLSMNQFGTSAIPAGVYSFHAIIRKVNTSGAPALKGQGDIQNDQSANYMVYPLDIDPENNPSTAINTVDVNGKAVKSVKYVNVAGMVSDVPFQGINIVVTEYTDGTRTTSKMLKR